MVKNNLLAVYLLMVGLPLMGLLGILEAGRAIAAPLSIAGDWTVEVDPAAHCANALAQPTAFSVSQSGTQALITLNDGHATTLEATIDGAGVTARSAAASITASIAGQLGARTLTGQMVMDGCAAIPFRAVRRAPGKGSD